MGSMSLFLSLAITMSLLISPSGGRVGINYGPISAFSSSGISLIVSLPNDLLPSAAHSSSFTNSWLQSNLPATTVSSIAVGNEAITNPNLTSFLLPAMQNLYLSLHSRNLHTEIKISFTLPLSALNFTYPPSASTFKPSVVPSVLPVLSFIRLTSSFIIINVHSFLDYSAHSGLKYLNLLDAQIDAVYYAMANLHFSSIPVVLVSETGWPSEGDDANNVGASFASAAAYNRNLTLSAGFYNASEVAIVPPSPAAAIRVRDQSCFGVKGAVKLPRVTVQEGAACKHPLTLKNKKTNN